MEVASADYVIEVSFEICNKVGGIHTVISSKSGQMLEHYPNYLAVGPYFAHMAREALEEINEIPKYLKNAFNAMEKKGLRCHYGKWKDAEKEPPTVLIEYNSLFDKKTEIKTGLWEDFKIDSYIAAYDFDEPVVWSTACGMLIEEISKELKGKKIVAHFHEWLAGPGLLYVKKNAPNVKTVFTTHATILGRSLSGVGRKLFEELEHLDVEKEAYNSNIQAKFTTERASAQNADIFTTVSEITGLEATKILGRKPDVLTLNGIDMRKFPTIEETSIKHVTCREKIREFLTLYFFPHYEFRLDKNLIYFISGRPEIHNKGIDVFIRSLGMLNEQLKSEKTDRTVTVFIWVPMGNTGIRTEILENKTYYQHITNFVRNSADEILKSITYDLILEKDLSSDTIFTKKFLNEARKSIIHFKRKGNPPMSTHYLDNEDNNPIIKLLKENNLTNSKSDSVKVIIYPVYLGGDDGLINLPYMDAIAGTHLGIYPSYYEPWGYTPLENAGMGVASVTTDIAGFGQFIKNKLAGRNPGIFVLNRFHKDDNSTTKSLFKILGDYAHLTHAERVDNKLNAKQVAELADWRILIKNYIIAHNMALKK